MLDIIDQHINYGRSSCEIDLILPTINTFTIESSFFQSLHSQSFSDFRVIIVDQGTEPFNFDLLKELNYCYLHSTKKGLSLCRNVALKLVQAPIISFVDDDSMLDKYYLERLYNYLHDKADVIAVAGLILDPQTKRPIVRSVKCLKKPIRLEKGHFNYCVSSCLSVKREYILEFDERFGLGTPYGSSEEMEYFFRLIQLGKIHFNPSLLVYHFSDKEKIKKQSFKEIFNRGWTYGMGRGAVTRKMFSHTKNYFYLRLFFITLLHRIFATGLDILFLNLKMGVKDIGYFCGEIRGFFAFSNIYSSLP